MKILDRKTINAFVAEQKKQQIDEGLRVAKKIDLMRKELKELEAQIDVKRKEYAELQQSVQDLGIKIIKDGL